MGYLKVAPNIDTASPQFMEDLLNQINERIIKETTREILRDERNILRDERKQAWSPKRTKAPFYGRARGNSRIVSFQKVVELAEKVVDHLGTPWKESKRGRPPQFSSKKLTSALLVKHYFPLSFETLREKLLEIRLDCRKDTNNRRGVKVPSTSELHWTLSKIPIKYLQEALRLLDDWTVELHTDLFGIEKLNKLGVDGTETTCIELEEYMSGLKKGLRRETNRVNALIRLVTNTVCEVKSSKKENLRDLTKLLKCRKKSKRSISQLEIYGDGAYDAEKNYEITSLNESELIVKPTKYTKKKPRGFFRKQGHTTFSARKYKIRKTVERPFGNISLRDGNKLWYKRPDMRQKGEILRFIAHNMKAYFMQEAWAKVFKNLSQDKKMS